MRMASNQMSLPRKIDPESNGANPDGGTAALVDMFQAMSDSSRLRIVALLRQAELAVGEIAQLLEQSQPRVSRHIRILEEAQLVERRKEGSWVFVRLVRSARVFALHQLIDAVPLLPREANVAQEDMTRLTEVRAEREAAAARYFSIHAN